MVDAGSIIEDFRAAMRAQDIDVRESLIADGAFHRVHIEGDRAQSKNGWYILHVDDHPAGAFGCWKRHGKLKFSWTAKETTQWSTEQKREFRERMERERQEKLRAQQARHAAAAQQAQALWDASEPADDDHPYLQRKACKPHGIRVGRWEVKSPAGDITLVSKLALLIPLRDTKKQIWSLQAIFPHDRNPLRRDKDYLKNGAKEGFFFTIGQPQDRVILVCEGYATGASLHESTGHAVVIAFDTSNLLPVARTLRERFSDYRIVFCADNDQWTDKPIPNPGVHWATEAAQAIGGMVAIPIFKDVRKKPTDFNDLFCQEGAETVKAFIDACLTGSRPPITPPWEDDPGQSSLPTSTEGHPVGYINGHDPYESADDDSGIPSDLINNPFFEILGYDHDQYFIFHKQKRQLMQYGRTDFSESAFIELADPGLFWEAHFKCKNSGFDKKAGVNFIMRRATECGIYDPDRIRGRGAWFDEGRIVYHHGNHLTVDGSPTEIGDFQTRFIYELQRSLPEPDPQPLSDEDGDRISEVANAFRWTRQASGALLCGWIMLAPICGALRWRPHIWLTGGAGTGKSSLLNMFVHPLLNGADLFVQGNTTEAGLRQKLRSDALPVLFEESEQNEDRDRTRIQHVLSLMRQASTESNARTYKGTVAGHSMEFLIRSMFCLASIQVGIKHQADVERVTVLSLRPKKEKERNAISEWDSLKKRLYEVVERDPTMGARLVRRAINNLPMIQQNIEVFAKAAGKIFGSAREGDQYGTLLAGTWSLFSSAPADEEQARIMIQSYNWDEHRDVSDTDESEQALASLMSAHVRAPKGLEYTVYELVAAASEVLIAGVDIPRLDAVTILNRYGMKVKDGYLLLSNASHELRTLMEKSNFAADWRGVLLRIPDADRNSNQSLKFNGVPSKCIRIPLDPVLRTAEPMTQESFQRSWIEEKDPIERGNTQ